MGEILAHLIKADPDGRSAGTQRRNHERGKAVVVLNLADQFSNDKVLSTAVSVGDSATMIPASGLPGRHEMHLYNITESTLYIGGSGVTVANGLPVPSGLYEPFHLFKLGSADLFGIFPSGVTGEVRILESA